MRYVYQVKFLFHTLKNYVVVKESLKSYWVVSEENLERVTEGN